MIANHFTAASNWPSIEKYGLVPYTLEKKFHPYFTSGVLAWPEEHDFESELGMACYHARKRETDLTVQIRVEYCDLDLQRPATIQAQDTLRLYHTLEVDGYRCHERLEMIVLGHIPPDCVHLAASYDHG